MIEGLRIDLTAEELLRHLDARIESHRGAAARCDAKRIRLEGASSSSAPPNDEDEDEDDEEEQLVMCWPGYVDELERRADRHRRREAAFVFLRDHLVAHEIYRLGEADLRLLELWPRHAGAPAE